MDPATNMITEPSDFLVYKRLKEKHVTGIYPDGRLQVKNKSDGFCLEMCYSRDAAIRKTTIGYLVGITDVPERLSVLINGVDNTRQRQQQWPLKNICALKNWRNDGFGSIDLAFPPFFHVEREALLEIITEATRNELIKLGPSTVCAYASAADQHDYYVLSNLIPRLLEPVITNIYTNIRTILLPIGDGWLATELLPHVPFETISEQIELLQKKKKV